MAFTLSPDFADAVADPERYGVILYTFYFSSTYGLWTRPGERVINGVTYKGGGSVISMGQVEQNGDGSVSELTLSLSTDPDKGLTDDILLAFYSENWRNQLVTIEFGLRDPTTDAIIDTVMLIRGQATEAPYTKGPSKHSIDLLIQSRTIELSAQGGLYRNTQSQKRIDASDTSLDQIGILSTTVSKSLKWGQA